MRACVNYTGGQNDECCQRLSCGVMRSAEAEVGGSAGTCSALYVVLVFTWRQCRAGRRFSSLKECGSVNTNKCTRVINGQQQPVSVAQPSNNLLQDSSSLYLYLLQKKNQEGDK